MNTVPLFVTARRCLLILFLILPGGRAAEVRLASLFTDGMVLQQHRRIPVWGWGEPGVSVRIEFNGGKTAGTVNADGTWQVVLEALEGGYTERDMVITVGDQTTTLHEVVVGEVWLCSGQSNMEYKLQPLADLPGAQNAPAASAYLKQVLNTADDSYLRHITVPHASSFSESLKVFEGRWEKATKGRIGTFSATAYFFGRELREKLDVPVGLINSSWGNTQIESWMPKAAFEDDGILAHRYRELSGRLQQNLEAYDEDEERRDYEERLKTWEEGGRKGRKPRFKESPLLFKNNPTGLYNAMIHPLVPYGIRGCIWYQGEANRFKPAHYAEKMAALIQSWRAVWDNGDFPFYYVQLAGFADPKKGEGWVAIQHEQVKVLSEKNVGIAITNDIGEAKEIHPRNKVDVGRRLAAWALAKDYGVEMKAYCGPLYQKHQIDGKSIVVSFGHEGSGLMAGEKQALDEVRSSGQPLQGFEICGTDGKWKPAAAEILSPDTVKVSHPDIPQPAHVRYAWSCYPEGANLYNQEGFPAALFSTAVE